MRTNSINANNDFAKDLRGINRKVKLGLFNPPKRHRLVILYRSRKSHHNYVENSD